MDKIYLWVDDIRPAPPGYIWAKSVNQAKFVLENPDREVYIVDLDHDAGDYTSDGGDFIRLLDWFEETGRNYNLHFHTMNPVGRMNMEAIANHNGWRIL